MSDYCTGGPNCCGGVGTIAQKTTVLFNLEEDSRREKKRAQHRRYNNSPKGIIRNRISQHNRNKRRLIQRIQTKQIQIELLERELKQCQQRSQQ